MANPFNTKLEKLPPAAKPAEPRLPTQLDQLAAAIHDCDRQLREAIDQFEVPLRAAMAAEPSDDALSELIRIRDELRAVHVFVNGLHLQEEWGQRIANRIQQLQLDGFYSDAEPAFRNIDFISVTRPDNNDRRYGTGVDVATVSFDDLAVSSMVAHRRLNKYLAAAIPDRSTFNVVVLPTDFYLAPLDSGSRKPRVVKGELILSDCRRAMACWEFLSQPRRS